MSLKKGDERLKVSVEPERLDVGDAEQIAKLMNERYPQMWSGITSDGIASLMSSSYTVWLGIKHVGKLVSFGYHSNS
ncbi:MAG: hypothetical protein M1540_00690 [Candidatus Bathyarchaeota archaeon]|nr:hypothetical protein [Candidatus Bathyarchaeota archaeon]